MFLHHASSLATLRYVMPLYYAMPRILRRYICFRSLLFAAAASFMITLSRALLYADFTPPPYRHSPLARAAHCRCHLSRITDTLPSAPCCCCLMLLMPPLSAAAAAFARCYAAMPLRYAAIYDMPT